MVKSKLKSTSLAVIKKLAVFTELAVLTGRWEPRVTGTIDVLFCDSLPELREPEVRHFLPQINPNGLILMHDASSHLKTVREGAKRMEDEGLISVVFLPTRA